MYNVYKKVKVSPSFQNSEFITILMMTDKAFSLVLL
jgi:hypothetical protein